MEKGFNTDIQYQGQDYHLQTEDWGLENPFLVSRIFTKGAVVKSIKTSYEKVLPKGLNSKIESIRLAMECQHKQILDLLLSGQLL